MYQHLDLEMYCIPSVHPAHRDRILYRQEMLSSHLVRQNFYFVLQKVIHMTPSPSESYEWLLLCQERRVRHIMGVRGHPDRAGYKK